MKTTFDFADVTITIDSKAETAAGAAPLTTLQASDLVEAFERSRALLTEQTATIERQTAVIAQLLEQRAALATFLTTASAQS